MIAVLNRTREPWKRAVNIATGVRDVGPEAREAMGQAEAAIPNRGTLFAAPAIDDG